MAFKMAGYSYPGTTPAKKHEEVLEDPENDTKFYGDRSRKEMRQDIREERQSLKEGGASREEVKEFNKLQRGRKKDIRLDTRINVADREEQEARDSGNVRKEERLANKGIRLSKKRNVRKIRAEKSAALEARQNARRAARDAGENPYDID